MAIKTYSELKTAIKNWTEWDSQLDDRVDEFIDLAEGDLNGDLQVNQMLTTETGTLTSGSASLSLPSDFISVEAFYLTVASNSAVLAFHTPQNIEILFGSDAGGQPSAYTIIGSNARLKPVPDSGYAYTLVYHQDIPPLTDAAPSNWVLATYPGAYLYGSLKHAAPYLSLGSPNTVTTWDTLYVRNVARIEADSERAEFPQGRLQISLDYATP